MPTIQSYPVNCVHNGRSYLDTVFVDVRGIVYADRNLETSIGTMQAEETHEGAIRRILLGYDITLDRETPFVYC